MIIGRDPSTQETLIERDKLAETLNRAINKLHGSIVTVPHATMHQVELAESYSRTVLNLVVALDKIDNQG